MNHSVFRMTLDLHDAASQATVVIKNEDTARRLSITLSESGRPYTISDECRAFFSAEKPDGNIVFNDCQIEGNTIYYDITPQTTAVVGVVPCEIKLYGANDMLLTSPQFTLVVAEQIYHNGVAVESATEINALAALISDTIEVNEEGARVNAEGKALILDMEAKRDELAQNIAETEEYANSALSSEQAAKASEEAAALSAEQAGGSASTAVLAATSAEESKTAAATHEANAADSKTAAAASAEAAKTSEEAAKQHADTIDTEQINANIAAKADDLYFDPATSLLYLMSNGQIIGTGVQVATSGGGGGATLSYAITMKNLLDSRVITVSEGTKVELKFSYSSVDEEGIDDGTGIGKIIVGNATKKTFTAVQGENVVDVTAFLTAGSNTVKVQVENSESAKKTLSYTITVAAAYMTSTFDASAPFTGEINFVYTPTGIAEKTVHFELDGAEIGTAVVTTSGRQQSYPIPAQSHGAHHLRAWFECEIEDTTVTSNAVSFSIICLEEGKTDPIIAVSNSLLANVERYTNIVTKYRVHDPSGLTAAITQEANGEVVANLTVDRTEQTWTYRPTTVGALEQTIRCGDKYVSWTQNVTESTIKVEAEAEALALYLSSYGRSNNEENPGVWESGNIACDFHGFNFVSDGWLMDEDDNTVLRVTGDARLHIPYRMFAYDFRTTGKTIEFELATREVLNYDAEVVSCYSGDRGFTITAQQLQLASEQSKMGTRYKEDEHLRVTFVVEKRSESRLLLCYINGIMSGAAQYPTGDDFSQADPVGITIGSNECTTDLYNIRVYDNNLTRHQVLDNWIADTQNSVERMERYLRNAIYDAYGRVVISQLPTDLCYMVLECPVLPQFKGDKKSCNGSFVDLIHPERSFTFQNAEIDVQGTSSQYYYVKNFKIKFKNGFILTDGTTAEVYQMNNGAVPVNTFTMKADVASSEGAFNVVLAMLYDDLCSYKTPAQQADPRVRQTIEGFPIVMFWNNGGETKFIGKYNFNNDKGTEEVFGFQSGDESWEILQNGTDRVGWHSADFSGTDWKNDFEARYPEDNTNITRLQQLAEWLVSTDTAQATGNAITPVTYDGVEYTTDTVEYRLAKFSAELSDHFVEEAIIFYYLFTELFLCIDQREKNAFPTYIASLDRWIVLFYDADSSLGTDNKGNLAFDYWLEDIDYTEAGDPVYNGQNSVLWKNLRATRYNEIMQLYKDMRTDGSLSYDSAIGRFEDHQSKWPEAIFNEDMYRKCLEPLIEEGDGLYIPMLQGKKEQWMKWWLYNRFRYFDSKHETGSSMENRITIRAHQKANIFLKSYANIVGHVYFNAAMVEHRMNRNEVYEFEWPASGAEDPVIGINDADLMTSLGDLSPLMVELIDVSGAPHITELKLGDGAEGYTNYSMNSITLGNNVLLRQLDLRNCVNLTQTVDASGCTNIEEIYCDGTAVTGVNLPNGGILKKLHLPATVTNLTLRNQTALTEFVMPSYANVTTLRLENNSSVIDPLAILDEIAANSRVRIIGFDKAVETVDEIFAFYDKLDTMRGLDENGNNVDKAQVGGIIRINSLKGSELAEMQSRYPTISVIYNSIVSNLYFYNDDGTELLYTDTVQDGGNGVYVGSQPTKATTAQYTYTFAGWSKTPGGSVDNDALASVTADRSIYAAFTATVRKYTVTWKNGSTTVETDTNVPYGTVPTFNGGTLTYTGTGDAADYEHSGWSPAVGAITGNTTYTAVWKYTGYISVGLVERTISGEYKNDTVESVGASAFFMANRLTGVEFTAAKAIGGTAFASCANLTTASFPAATTIGNYAFYSCHNLRTVSFPVATSIGERAFGYCTYLTTASFPAVTSIGISAFQGCSSLTTASFPAVTSIGSSAFQYCKNLTTISFPAATSIGGETFQGCSNLTTVSFPAATTIGNYAFSGCTKLTALILAGSSVCAGGYRAFTSTLIASGTGYIYVPASLVAVYQSASYWSSVAAQISAIEDSEYYDGGEA